MSGSGPGHDHAGTGHAGGHAGEGAGGSGNRQPESGHGHAGNGDDRAEHPHGGIRAKVTHALRPHRHDHTESFDDSLLADRQGIRALWISLVGLLATAVIQLAVVLASHSVGLLSDTVHNFADALTALPIGAAFMIGRRRPTSRYTYGFGRAEDLAGLSVVAVIAFSVAVAIWESVTRLLHPHPVGHLWAVALAGGVGFAGNELAAGHRITVGRRIGSAALVADGRHARADGFTSLAVVAGAIGVAAGWSRADPVVGLAISGAVLVVLWGAGRDVLRRLMDASDPDTVEEIRRHARQTEGVLAVDGVRVRWVGHELQATLDLTVPGDMSVARAHEVAETVHHRLLHQVPRLTDVTIHTNPDSGDGEDPHAETAHHRRRGRGR